MTTELSDTPETDNLARGNHVVPTEWAEQLERERDEARAQRDSLQALSQSLAETYVKLKTERDEWAKLCGQYKQERDEARADLEHIKEYGTEEINAAVELRQKLASALIERDEAWEQLKKEEP
jgi:uncharacterized coiled-coil DUF342 family protein